MRSNHSEVSFSTLVQEFFSERLISQRSASPETIASYRDTFRLLLSFAAERTKKDPSGLALEDLEAPLILDFLDHLERKRGNSARTRNARLAAIRSFMRYASFQGPAYLPVVEHVLAIPVKRFDRPALTFLSREEMQAIIETPDRSTWSGQRDQVMFQTMYNTGARASEITGLQVGNLFIGRQSSILVRGKGRKHRAIPLWKSTTRLLKAWLPQIEKKPDAPVFPNRVGKHLSVAGVEHRLQVAVQKATRNCPSLQGRSISPHCIRHSTALHLLQSGVDITVIALWLGHESPATTHLYVEADLAMKEEALKKLQEPSTKTARYQPSDALLRFLDSF